MTDENLFTIEEQIEIVRIMKGVFVYARHNSKILTRESLVLRLLEESCNKVSFVIKDKNKKSSEDKNNELV